MEWAPGDGSTFTAAEVTLPDPASYYGGLKPGTLLGVSEIRRALSGPYGDYETGRFEVTLSDHQRQIRGILEAVPPRYWTNRTLTVRMATDTRRRGLGQPTTVGLGVVVEPVFSGLKVVLRAQDVVGSKRWGLSMGTGV